MTGSRIDARKNNNYILLVSGSELKFLRRCGTLWSAREIASMAPSAEQARHAENVFHIALRLCETPRSPPAPDQVSIENCKQVFFTTACIYNPKNI